MTTKPRFFKTPADFRKWLEKNHETAAELWVGLYKKHTGKPSITWPEVVDQVLCFGWIDGIRKSIDPDSYMNRVTPRRKGSNWSAVNIKRVQELREAGLMTPAGERAFAERDARKVNQYSFERDHAEFSAAQQAAFRKNRKAWAFFQAQPPYYRKQMTWWVISAKQAATQERRLARLIADSAAGMRIQPMQPTPRKD
jgi:uncharacterized protein YdeI (YjbR/CyaY-like superfamily)